MPEIYKMNELNGKQADMVNTALPEFLRPRKMPTSELYELKKRAAELNREALKLQSEVNRKCHHPVGKLVLESSYYSGSYLDTAHTTYYLKCTICGDTKEVGYESHNWYG